MPLKRYLIEREMGNYTLQVWTDVDDYSTPAEHWFHTGSLREVRAILREQFQYSPKFLEVIIKNFLTTTDEDQ